MICNDLSIALAPILARYDKNQIVVVYDQPAIVDDEVRFSHDSVYNQAMKNKATGELPKTVVDYLNYKIIDIADSENERYVKQNFVDWDWNYTLKDFPKVEED